MTGSTRHWFGGSVLVLALLPHNAGAQTVAQSFEELRALVKSGDTVYVTDTSGRRTKGKIGDLSASSLQLLVANQQADGRDVFLPQPPRSERDVSEILIERRAIDQRRNHDQ